MRREYSIPEGAFVVGFASRLVERKGWGDFLDAVALLAPKLSVFYLVAGDGEDRDKAEARIRKLGLAGQGRMLGHIDWMRHFYDCLDCFVMPSHWEPHGLSHLEAQAFGVPVVVSSVPGLASTVGDERDALLFRAADAQALADCIRRLATDAALRDRLIEGGRANSARYTMTAFTASLEDLYAAAVVPRNESVDGE
jgi:glycosyltransferase involved in cell wall biosynthesis